jgi:hypothetical protein
MPRLSTLRADRSLCRSTGDPKPPGSGWQNPRAGTAPRIRCLGMPSGTAPCTKRGDYAITETVTKCQGKSDDVALNLTIDHWLSGRWWRTFMSRSAEGFSEWDGG